MAINDLYSKDSPYVHSNIYHLIDSVTNYFTAVNTDHLSKELDQTIDRFIQWINQLQTFERDLYDFFGVSDFQGLNTKLFGYETNVFSHIAQQVILRSSMIHRLMPSISKEQGKKILSAFGNGEQLWNTLYSGIEDLPLNEFRKNLLAQLKNFLEPFSQNGKITKIAVEKALNTGNEKGLGTAIMKDLKDWTRAAKLETKSYGSKIRQVTDAIIKQTTHDFSISYPTFESIFLPEYLNELYKAQIPLTNDTDLLSIAKEYSQLLYNKLFAGKSFTLITDLLARRGEGMIDYAVSTGYTDTSGSLTTTISIHDVGHKTEQDLQAIFGNTTKDIRMTNYGLKGDSNFSQSDTIIKVETQHGSRIFRVQSKDSFLYQLEKSDNKKSFPPMIVHTRSVNNVSKILDMLLEKTSMTDSEIDMLGYYIANMVWFYEKGTYSPEDDSVEKRTRGVSGGLAGAQALINQVISRGIQAFIGITVNEANTDAPIDPEATNIFYFLGARALFPVSEVLKAAVTQMQNLKSELMQVHFKINMDADFDPDNVKQFWQNKAEKLNNTFTSGYTDSGLIDVGKRQGASIMKSVTGTINFNFNIEKIFKISSYLV